jgi:hypothetical protein
MYSYLCVDALAPSRTIGSLFVLSGILGIVILALDSVLRSGAPQHYDALIGFVIIDFLLGALCFPMPQKLMLKLAAIWSTLRSLIQLCDVMPGPMFQFTNVQFADYLFNPLSSLPKSWEPSCDSAGSDRSNTHLRHRNTADSYES